MLIGIYFGYSADDWRFAAEQFVKRIPDKVIVHRASLFSFPHLDIFPF
jgi:hypothetical protein